MKKFFFVFLILSMIPESLPAMENEVIPESGAKVYVREHPQTGKPFVSLRSEALTQDLFQGFTRREIRPDYKMLDADAKGIPYDGPASDRTKVYVFAATLITLGAAGAVVTAALPVTAAAGAGASGGTGLLGTGAVAIVAGTAGTIAVESHIKPGEEHYQHTAESVSTATNPKKATFQEALREGEKKDFKP